MMLMTRYSESEGQDNDRPESSNNLHLSSDGGILPSSFSSYDPARLSVQPKVSNIVILIRS